MSTFRSYRRSVGTRTMFSNLTYQDKQAFFSLLDEYFASRPNPLQRPSGPADSSNGPSIQLSTISRLLAPQPAQASSPTTPTSPKSEQELAQEARQREKEAQRLEQVSKYAQVGIKHSVNGARSSLGMVAKNNTLMKGLDNYGLGGMVRGVDGAVNPKKIAPVAVVETETVIVPEKKKAGMSGMLGGKTGGITGMFRDAPKGIAFLRKANAADALTHIASAPAQSQQAISPASRVTNLAPPVRRTTSSTPAVIDSGGSDGQAQCLYDYSGSDSGDLSIQSGQIVMIVEKTSTDWWTCEDGNGRQGLVPANYLKEL